MCCFHLVDSLFLLGCQLDAEQHTIIGIRVQDEPVVGKVDVIWLAIVLEQLFISLEWPSYRERERIRREFGLVTQGGR
jgi:hypothetical protein